MDGGTGTLDNPTDSECREREPKSTNGSSADLILTRSYSKGVHDNLPYDDVMMRGVVNALRLAAVPVGVVIGVWTASMGALGCGLRRKGPSISSCALAVHLPAFAAWECALLVSVPPHYSS